MGGQEGGAGERVTTKPGQDKTSTEAKRLGPTMVKGQGADAEGWGSRLPYQEINRLGLHLYIFAGGCLSVCLGGGAWRTAICMCPLLRYHDDERGTSQDQHTAHTPPEPGWLPCRLLCQVGNSPCCVATSHLTSPGDDKMLPYLVIRLVARQCNQTQGPGHGGTDRP